MLNFFFIADNRVESNDYSGLQVRSTSKHLGRVVLWQEKIAHIIHSSLPQDVVCVTHLIGFMLNILHAFCRQTQSLFKASCTDLESFVRGNTALTTFFSFFFLVDEGRERIQIPLKAGHHWPLVAL